jgi:hypothetical protein
MTDRIKEQLSAFLDGELPDPESALLVKRLERDDELRGALSRYSLIGAVLRSDGDVPAGRHVAAPLSAPNAREPARGAAWLRVPRRDELLRAGAGLAVAAGVALGAVVLVQQVASQDASVPAAVVAQSGLPAVQPVVDELDEAPGSYVTPPAADASGIIPPAELANYLVAHYGYASPLVRRSVGAGLISDVEPGLLQPLPAAETSEP